jgi:hypothetical protein
MSMAILFGAGSGALHAVTGPDHLLSLGPAALGRREGSLRVGLTWGLGHAVGSVIVAIPLLFLASAVALPGLTRIGERVAGFTLLATAAWSWWSMRHPPVEAASAARTRGPLLLGLIHGVTGAGALVLLLPVFMAGDARTSLQFLLAFAIGSTLAMGALTTAIGAFGRRLEARVIANVQRVLLSGSVLLGGSWLLAS